MLSSLRLPLIVYSRHFPVNGAIETLGVIGMCGESVLSALDPRASIVAGWKLLDQIH